MSDFLMKPKVDFAFKEIMMDEKARAGFLAAVLHINPEDIKKPRYLIQALGNCMRMTSLGYLI